MYQTQQSPISLSCKRYPCVDSPCSNYLCINHPYIKYPCTICGCHLHIYERLPPVCKACSALPAEILPNIHVGIITDSYITNKQIDTIVYLSDTKYTGHLTTKPAFIMFNKVKLDCIRAHFDHFISSTHNKKILISAKPEYAAYISAFVILKNISKNPADTLTLLNKISYIPMPPKDLLSALQGYYFVVNYTSGVLNKQSNSSLR